MEATLLHDSIFQHPGFGDLILEIKIGGVDAWARQFAKQLGQIIETQPAGGQQTLGDR